MDEGRGWNQAAPHRLGTALQGRQLPAASSSRSAFPWAIMSWTSGAKRPMNALPNFESSRPISTS